MSTGHKYAIQCDHLQIKVEQGQLIWNALIFGAQRIHQDEFEAACDFEDWLEEGESLDDFVSGDPDAAYYKTQTAQGTVYFAQHSGFEFFFTETGAVPQYDPAAPTHNLDEHMRSALARLLFHPNHPLLQNAYGFEKPATHLEDDFVLIQGSGLRFQLLREGVVVAGMQVQGSQIKDIYVTCFNDMRRKGLATEIVARAEAFMGKLEHSTSLTPDGEKFVAAQRRRNDSESLDM